MSNELVPTQDPFQTMERLDEEQVLDEIKGRAIESLVYEIEQGGKTVTGLSLAGIREVTRSMNAAGRAKIGITDREPMIVETEDYFEVKAFAQDTLNGGGYWGIKRQSKKYGNGSINQFALEQALAKAQRNALRGLIPEWFAKEMIDAYRGQGHVKTVKGTVVSSNNKNKALLDRAALIQQIAKDIPYYGHTKHVVAMFQQEEKAGNINSSMSDAELFGYANDYASKRADEKSK